MNNAPSDRDRRDHHAHPERGNGQQPPREPIAITDKRRRIDPVTGRMRDHTPASPQGGHAGPGTESRQVDSDRVAELTADLQRLQVEYAHYRRRIDRDRSAVAENARASVADRFLGILDDLDRARERGDTSREPLHGLDWKIRAILTGLGVAAFAERGDRFDPVLHEAASHQGHGTDLVVDAVLRRGFTFGERKVLRTALVTVIDREQYEHDSAADPPAAGEAARPGDSGTAAQVSDPAPALDASAESGHADRPAGPDPPAGTDKNPGAAPHR